MKHYKIWSKSKSGCDTFEELQAYEKTNGFSVSSVIQCSNIAQIIDAVEMELDQRLLYVELSETVENRIAVYRAEYNANIYGFMAALNDGAVYDFPKGEPPPTVSALKIIADCYGIEQLILCSYSVTSAGITAFKILGGAA